MKYYDIDQDGNVSYEEFIRGLRYCHFHHQLLRDELTDRKKQMVMKAFDQLDKDKSGVITVQDVINIYDVRQHPEFIEGKKSKEQIIGEFLDGFDGAKGNSDGKISKQEFLDYYTDLAMSAPSEEYFVRMMEQVWCMSEDEDAQVTKDQVRHLTGLLRQRLMVKSNSSQDEYVLR